MTLLEIYKAVGSELEFPRFVVSLTPDHYIQIECSPKLESEAIRVIEKHGGKVHERFVEEYSVVNGGGTKRKNIVLIASFFDIENYINLLKERLKNIYAKVYPRNGKIYVEFEYTPVNKEIVIDALITLNLGFKLFDVYFDSDYAIDPETGEKIDERFFDVYVVEAWPL